LNHGVYRAIQDRQFVISGPVNLRQGDFAIIGRLPVYANPDVASPPPGEESAG
jgi:sensor domain CHASE-containing protein